MADAPEVDWEALRERAREVMGRAYAPYSRYPVGAAALYIERRTFLEDNTPLELVRSQYRGDAYDFVVELNLSGATRESGGSRPSSENRS